MDCSVRKQLVAIFANWLERSNFETGHIRKQLEFREIYKKVLCQFAALDVHVFENEMLYSVALRFFINCSGLVAELPNTFGYLCSFPGLLMLLAALWLYFYFFFFMALGKLS